MKKFLFALILCFPLFFKLDSFAEVSYDGGVVYTSRIPVASRVFIECDEPFACYYDSYTDYVIFVSKNKVPLRQFTSIDADNYTTWESNKLRIKSFNVYSSVSAYSNYDACVAALNSYQVSSYDSSIVSGLLWHNSFYLFSNNTYEVVSFSHTTSGNVLNGDTKSTILEIYVNDVQKDVITKNYNPLNSVFDGINFHHSDYGINNGDIIRVRAYYYLNNNYGNYKEISWVAKNKIDNSENLITNPSGEHGGGGSSRNPIETTIKNPYVPPSSPVNPPSNPPIETPNELAPIQTTITHQQVIEVNPTTEQTVMIQNIYIQGYEIPDYPDYEDQLKTIEELLKGINSGDTITTITNNYEYTYNYNFDFDIDFGDLNLDQTDLKSFIQDFPSFSEKYISFLSSFGVPVWLIVLIVSCFGLIFVALLIKIAKLLLPI